MYTGHTSNPQNTRYFRTFFAVWHQNCVYTDVKSALDRRKARFDTGQAASESELEALSAILPGTSLDSLSLLEIGRAFDFLEGDVAAARWFRAGLVKAEAEYRTVLPGDPRAWPLLAALDQTKALWRLEDYATLERRFALAHHLNPPLSPEARRAAHLYAEMLYYQRKFSEAAAAILQLAAEHRQAGDLGHLERSDLEEMDWVQGIMLCSAGRDAEAAPHLERVLAYPASEHRRGAMAALVLSLARLQRCSLPER
jgi:hypothetical protein